jgi:hypothetical protein
MKKIVCSVLVFIMIFTMCACAKTNDVPAEDAGTAETESVSETETETETETEPETETERETASSETDAEPETVKYDYHTMYDESVTFRYKPLDKDRDRDIYSACVNGAAQIDKRFRRSDAASGDTMADREEYTDLRFDCFVLDGDSGKGFAFLRFRPVPMPDFHVALFEELYFILRTKDYGKTWEISENYLCLYVWCRPQSLYFDGNLYFTDYTEVNGGNMLYSNDDMDSCYVCTCQNGFPSSYVTGIRRSDDGRNVIFSVASTRYGFFYPEGEETRYDVVCDLQMNVLSYEETYSPSME